jgi:hypothetical protein
MTFLARGYLIAAIGAAIGVVALHLIVMRQPPRDIMPTARFVPPGPAVARTVTRRPEDLLLLLVRTAAILMLGTAFAKPVWHARRVPVLRVVIADRSRVVGDMAEMADSARRVLVGARDVLVLFDSAPRVIEARGGDSLRSVHRAAAAGNVSAALVGALRAAGQVANQADSIEMTLVSPVSQDEVDAATDSIRGLWPGAVRLVRVASRVDSGRPLSPTVDWPADGHAAGATARSVADTVNAVVAGGDVVVAPFERRWRVDTSGARVIARWVDGEPAAVERARGVGCARTVAIPVASVGDLVLRPEWQRFAHAIRGACGRAGDHPGVLAQWDAATTRPTRVASRVVVSAAETTNRLTTWLLGGVIVALLAEILARRGRWR